MLLSLYAYSISNTVCAKKLNMAVFRSLLSLSYNCYREMFDSFILPPTTIIYFFSFYVFCMIMKIKKNTNLTMMLKVVVSFLP